MNYNKLNEWYDKQPEPNRFLMFFSVFVGTMFISGVLFKDTILVTMGWVIFVLVYRLPYLTKN